ncbi:kinase-like domain-containing protein [Mycena olivaceomarginata]|nr:kinase-like domain-containing protein [Mycena olivaceomarginata]
MFYREALYWRSLCHPNFLPFLGVSTKVLPPLSLISPWMENGCLMRYPEQNPDYDRLKAVMETAEGMRYLHELDPPIVHPDIRGANILVTDDGHCCLADFGLSAVTGMTVTSVRKGGSVAWMAPEIMEEISPGTEPSPTRDPTCFIDSSLGQIFTGNPPFNGLFPSLIILKVLAGEQPPVQLLVHVPKKSRT